MKKVLLSFFTISFLAANSQFVIDESDFAIQGDTVIYATDSSFSDNSSQLGIVGESVIWDFSSLGAIREDTVLFILPSAHPTGNVFGNSSVSYNQNIQQNFLKVGNSGIDIIGYSMSMGGLIDTSLLSGATNIPETAIFKYNNSGLFYIDLDAEFGDQENGNAIGLFTAFYGDSFNVPGTGNIYIDSFRVKETVTFDSEIDGSGTLKLPDGDYFAIRQKVSYKKDYTVGVLINISPIPLFPVWIWQDIPGIEFTINETNYRYFGKWQKFPVLDISLEANGAFTTSKYQPVPEGSQVSIDSKLESSFNCYVSNNQLNIKSDNTIQKISIIDASGRIINNINTNDKELLVDFNYSGMYIIQVYTTDDVFSTKIIN